MADIFDDLFRREPRDVVIYNFVPPLSNYMDEIPELKRVRSPFRRITFGLAAAALFSIPPMLNEEPERRAFYQRARHPRVSSSTLKRSAKLKRRTKRLKRDKAARKARKVTRLHSKTRKSVCVVVKIYPSGRAIRIIDHVISHYDAFANCRPKRY